MNRDFIGALLQLNAEKGVPREQLVRTVEDAIQSAYRRVAPGYEDVYVRLDIDTGKMRVFRARRVVIEIEDPLMEWSLDEAKTHRPDAEIGELIEYEELDPDHFGRVGAQIAGQVIRQRLREAERETLFDEFAHREGEIITGSVSRVEPRGVILDLGKAEAVLPTTDQSATEHYRIGQHVKAFVLEVRRTTRGPLIYVSRTHKNFLRRMFELEVPEIHAGTVEIKAIAREAGSRSKVAVSSRQEGLDPVGATVGQRGGRVQAVVAELGGEKIDVIPWSDDPALFVANALSPAQVVGVAIDEDNRIAAVTVPERMLSLAIGREGQNARLAAKLTGWRIDIRSDQPARPEPTAVEVPPEGVIAEPESEPVDEVAATPDTAAVQPDPPIAEPELERRVRAGRRSPGRARRRGGRARGRRSWISRSTPCPPHGCRNGGVTVVAPGAAVARRAPTRTCVACRTERSKRELVRVVRTPAGLITIDHTGRLPGRGAYLCADGSCWRLALRRASIERALGVTLPTELRSRLEQGDPEELQGGPHGP